MELWGRSVQRRGRGPAELEDLGINFSDPSGPHAPWQAGRGGGVRVGRSLICRALLPLLQPHPHRSLRSVLPKPEFWMSRALRRTGFRVFSRLLPLLSSPRSCTPVGLLDYLIISSRKPAPTTPRRRSWVSLPQRHHPTLSSDCLAPHLPTRRVPSRRTGLVTGIWQGLVQSRGQNPGLTILTSGHRPLLWPRAHLLPLLPATQVLLSDWLRGTDL